MVHRRLGPLGNAGEDHVNIFTEITPDPSLGGGLKTVYLIRRVVGTRVHRNAAAEVLSFLAANQPDRLPVSGDCQRRRHDAAIQRLEVGYSHVGERVIVSERRAERGLPARFERHPQLGAERGSRKPDEVGHDGQVNDVAAIAPAIAADQTHQRQRVALVVQPVPRAHPTPKLLKDGDGYECTECHGHPRVEIAELQRDQQRANTDHGGGWKGKLPLQVPGTCLTPSD